MSAAHESCTSGFEVVAEAATCDEARDLARRLDPDVMVVDVRLPDGSGLDVCRDVRRRTRDTAVVVLTMYAGDDEILAAADAGAAAFVAKDAPARDVVEAAGRAAEKPRTYASPELDEARQRREQRPTVQLSPREREVLQLLADGYGIAQIARELYIGESTAKTHVAKLYDKLGAGNRAQAIMSALALGLVAAPTSSQVAQAAAGRGQRVS